MTYKICHISDTHIHNLKYHDVYRRVFEVLDEKLQDIEPDFIVHTGDIAHSKVHISPEFVEVCSMFLRILERNAMTYMILGNHDGNCFSGDHEVLTRQGWVSIETFVEEKRQQEVATFNASTQEIEFQVPFSHIKKQHLGTMLHLFGKEIDALVTPDHEFVYSFSGKKNKDKFFKKEARRLPSEAAIPLNGKFKNAEEDPFAQLLGFSFAEGSFVLKNEKTGVCRIQFHLKNEREINFLEDILARLNYSFIKRPEKGRDGVFYINIYSSLAKEVYNFFDGKKQIPQNIFAKDKNFIYNFLVGYLNGDGGNKKNDFWTFHSIDKESIRALVSLFRLVGASSHYNPNENIFGNYENSKQQFQGSCNLKNREQLDFTRVQERKEVFFTGNVYCLSVENENLLIRRNEKIFVAGNCRNLSRQDAISPIVDALGLRYLNILKESGEYLAAEQTTEAKPALVLNVLSAFDKENWVKVPTDRSAINIALYHGSVSGCETDLGWKMDHGEVDFSIFKPFDYAFLGDIHKTNQILDNAGRVRYAGSTVQQNHGETNDKGFLLWEIEDHKTFRCTHHKLLNPKPFVSLCLTPEGHVPKKAEVPETARLRLISEHPITLDKVRRAIDVANSRFKPEAVTFLNRADSAGRLDEAFEYHKENLRDRKVQERMIREYLEPFSCSEETLQKVFSLNARYSALVHEEAEVSRNVDFEVLEAKWSNLFNYGEDNHFRFKGKSGIVGLFGESYSGKSSMIDSMLFTMFGSISKRNPGGKSINVLNNKKDSGYGWIKLQIGNRIYTIKRTIERYTKKLRGRTTEEARTILDFTEYNMETEEETSLNGVSRTETDRHIARYFGTIDDFLITSLSSQFRSLDFIDTKSTGRKEILGKFLDLDQFERKFALAKEESKELKGKLKRFNDRDLDSEYQQAQKEVADNKAKIKFHESRSESLQKSVAEAEQEERRIAEAIASASTKIVEIDWVENQLKVSRKTKKDKCDELAVKKFDLATTHENLRKVRAMMKEIDAEALDKRANAYATSGHKVVAFGQEIEKKEASRKRLQFASRTLAKVPCGDKYPQCPFIQDAMKAKKTLGMVEEAVRSLAKKRSEADAVREAYVVNGWQELSRKLTALQEQETKLGNAIPRLEVEIRALESELKVIDHNIEEYEKEKAYYVKHKEVIENLQSAEQQHKKAEQALASVRSKAKANEQTLRGLYVRDGELSHRSEVILQEGAELADTRESYEAFDLYLRCMHANGISYDIIKKSLPAINTELSKILSNITDFSVHFENDESRLNLQIKRPSDPFPVPLELASGTEKEICAMAIRLALLNVSSLPRGDVFFLDEPGTAFDQEHLEKFSHVLTLIKNMFKCVLLISHLDDLKETAEHIITIDKRNGFAYLNNEQVF